MSKPARLFYHVREIVGQYNDRDYVDRKVHYTVAGPFFTLGWAIAVRDAYTATFGDYMPENVEVDVFDSNGHRCYKPLPHTTPAVSDDSIPF